MRPNSACNIGLAIVCAAALSATGALAQDRTVILVRHGDRAVSFATAIEPSFRTARRRIGE
jgi:hypothetical protein